ncbi:DMT family transporter [Cohaesibacter haloalkalitolerans]|uniref:DMT family transporter n=1 Tax=Cohaesibacter haloalkalitolerans TaxID=1162980 RepID=UPI000E64C45D|nr:DMT family transporter [Cohaesibacter haloalkalitolerans]
MKNNTAVAYVLLALATLCWGGNVVIGRAVRGDLPPLGLSFWRWFFCCLILLVITAPRLKASWPVIRKHWKLLLAMSATGIAAFNPLQYQALHSTTAINSTLILATCPAFMALLSLFILKEKLGLAQIAGILVSFFGVVVVITAGDFRTLFHLKFTGGDIWMVGAAIVWALYSITVKMRPVTLDPLVMLMVITGLGALMLLPLYIWETLTYQAVTLTPTNLAAIVYVTFIASLLAYFSWNKGVGLIGPSKAGVTIHLMPVWVAFLAFFFLGERLEGYHLMGIAFIALGILLNSRRARV